MNAKNETKRNDGRSASCPTSRNDGGESNRAVGLENCDNNSCRSVVARKEPFARSKSHFGRNGGVCLEQCENRNEYHESTRAGLTPSLEIVDGIATALSTQVAFYFNKRHDHVVRQIKNLITKKPELNLHNFVQIEYKDSKGELRPAYRMDRKGFTLLAMGFTGEKALDFKIAYIDAFDDMERKLYGAQNALTPKYLTNRHQYELQQAVARKVAQANTSFSVVWSALKHQFKVPKYSFILDEDFEVALGFVDSYVPKAPRLANHLCHSERLPQSKTYLVDADFLERQRLLVYSLRYLFRKPLTQAMKVMQVLDVPDAEMLWDAIHDMNLVNLEHDLTRLGFGMDQLDCYNAWARKHQR